MFFLFFFGSFASIIGAVFYRELPRRWNVIGPIFSIAMLVFAVLAIWNDSRQRLIVDAAGVTCVAPLRSWSVSLEEIAELRIRRNRNARILVIRTIDGRRYDYALNRSLADALGPFADSREPLRASA